MENCTFNSRSRSQSRCPINGFNVWKEDSIPDSVRLNIIASSITINSITSPLIAAANFLVCWSIFKTQTLRRNNYKLLLAFLALTDFLVGAVALPLTVASRICRLNPKCDSCIPDGLMDFFVITLQTVSYYQVVLISAERYLAIQHALRYNVLVTSKKLMCAMVVPWMISLSSSISFFFVPFVLWNPIFLLLAIVSSFFLVYWNIRVLIESKRHHRAIAAQVITLANQENGPQSVSTVSNNVSRSAEFKAGKTTALIVGVFLFFSVTAFVFLCFIYINFAKRPLPSSFVHIVLEWTYTFLHLNSLVNPLVYCWRMADIRRVFYENLRKLFCKSS